MKRCLLFLLPLLNVLGAWADVTDLPKLTTDPAKPIYYVIRNTRSVSGSMMYYDQAKGLLDNNPAVVDDKYKFYFEGTDYKNVTIRNAAANGLALAGPSQWTKEGVKCTIEVTSHSSKAGLAIKYGPNDNNYLNDQNWADGYTNWYSDDAGSIFVIEPVEGASAPAQGQTYFIESPVFVKKQQALKGISVDATSGKTIWHSVDLNQDIDKWVVNYNSAGNISLKNVAKQQYLNGQSLSANEVFGTLTYLGQNQYNITIGGIVLHAEGHGGGANASGNIIHWSSGLNSASGWTFAKADEVGFIEAYSVGMTVPVTTDEANKHYVSIRSGRPGNAKGYWYTYDSSDQKIRLANFTGNDDQQWYFKGKVVNGTEVQLQLFSKAAEGLVMSYQNTENGHGKIVAQADNTQGWTNTWKFVSSDGKAPYGLKTFDGANYLSNHSGPSYKMGLYNEAPANDPGTAMYLYVNETFDADINALVAEAEKKLAGTGLGYYSSTEAYTTALNTAKGLHPTNTMAEFGNAYYALRDAVNGLPLNAPVAGKFYRIYNNAKNTCLYADFTTTGRAQFAAYDPNNDPNKVSSIFYFDGSKMVSYNTGLHLTTDASNMLAYATAVDQSNKIQFAATPEPGKLYVKFSPKDNANNCTRYLYNETAGNSDAANGVANNNNNYKFQVEEVTWLPVAVNLTNKLTTFYSPVELALSSNRVKAYTAKVAGTSVQLTAQNVVPANTGVMIEYQDGAETEKLGGKDYVFLEINKAATVAAVASDLKGSTADVHVTPEANQTCYVLGMPANSKLAFYKAALNYNSNKSFYNNGFKAYLPVAVPAAAAISFYGLDFNQDGTTGIENIENGHANENVVMYDLSGRRVRGAQKGIYIINGKKVIK